MVLYSSIIHSLHYGYLFYIDNFDSTVTGSFFFFQACMMETNTRQNCFSAPTQFAFTASLVSRHPKPVTLDRFDVRFAES